MKIITTIIRIIVGLLFAALGFMHFYAYELMAVYMPLPFGSKAFVLFTGALITLSAIAVMINRYTQQALLVICITLGITGFVVLIPMLHREPDELLKRVQLPVVYKL